MMKILITETQYQSVVNELETRYKPLHKGGADHHVFQSKSNPNIIYKIGNQNIVRRWVNIFKQNEHLFPKIYRTGEIVIPLEKFKNDVANSPLAVGTNRLRTYVALEKLDTNRAEKEWEFLDNICLREMKYTFNYFVGRKLSIDDDEPDFDNNFNTLEELIKTKHKEAYPMFIRFVNLIKSIYEIFPSADIHKYNFGYDTEGNLKCLDI